MVDNRLIIFDLDGVLIDSREVHFNSLNLALAAVDPRYIITNTEQASIYEGMTTKTKLEILSHRKGLPTKLHQLIWENKQKYSATMFESFGIDYDLVNYFKIIRDNKIKIGIASNSIRETLDSCLKAIGVFDLIDISFSNEDVSNPKPSSEIYEACMRYCNTRPKNTVIFEDSEIGLTAAYSSGAMVEKIENRSQLTLERILNVVKLLNE